jgi:hypothetical protein
MVSFKNVVKKQQNILDMRKHTRAPLRSKRRSLIMKERLNMRKHLRAFRLRQRVILARLPILQGPGL